VYRPIAGFLGARIGGYGGRHGTCLPCPDRHCPRPRCQRREHVDASLGTGDNRPGTDRPARRNARCPVGSGHQQGVVESCSPSSLPLCAWPCGAVALLDRRVSVNGHLGHLALGPPCSPMSRNSAFSPSLPRRALAMSRRPMVAMPSRLVACRSESEGQVRGGCALGG